jgi:hypothetical protein
VKLALVVCNSHYTDHLMRLLRENGIDYFTSWDKATGKGHGTEPHLGTGTHSSTNTVTMIAFEDEAVDQARRRPPAAVPAAARSNRLAQTRYSMTRSARIITD